MRNKTDWYLYFYFLTFLNLALLKTLKEKFQLLLLWKNKDIQYQQTFIRFYKKGAKNEVT